MSTNPKPVADGPRAGGLVVRYAIPVAMGVGGLVLIVSGHGTTIMASAGVVLLVFALMVWMMGWLFRMSVASNRDREREEEARDHFARTGRWPGDEEE